MMRCMSLQTLLAVAAALATGAANSPLSAEDAAGTEALAVEGRGIAKGFAGDLMTTLQSAIKDRGLAGGISACNVTAPVIAAEAAKKSGWSVGRTSLKIRNPSNTPDAFERTALEDFEVAARAGTEPAKLERQEIVMRDGKRTFRFMKAIPTAEPCLACHGSSLKPDTVKAIRDLYPDDQATGYALGDLRGAFTLTRELD